MLLKLLCTTFLIQSSLAMEKEETISIPKRKMEEMFKVMENLQKDLSMKPTTKEISTQTEETKIFSSLKTFVNFSTTTESCVGNGLTKKIKTIQEAGNLINKNPEFFKGTMLELPIIVETLRIAQVPIVEYKQYKEAMLGLIISDIPFSQLIEEQSEKSMLYITKVTMEYLDNYETKSSKINELSLKTENGKSFTPEYTSLFRYMLMKEIFPFYNERSNHSIKYENKSFESGSHLSAKWSVLDHNLSKGYRYYTLSVIPERGISYFLYNENYLISEKLFTDLVNRFKRLEKLDN